MFPDMSYKDHAAIYMSMAMAVNFFGYEFGRSGVLTLFTSPVNGKGTTRILVPFYSSICIRYGFVLSLSMAI